VTKALDEVGVTTYHARPKGELKSKLASRIRELARDPSSLTMSAYTELFLYIARDTQMIDTVIRPSLDMADVVVADRYLYSPLVLSRARDGVAPEDIDNAISVAARGLWPDLVIYCDVDINTSYVRKKMDKIESPREPDDFGRKGLRGLGLRVAMRNQYLKLAKANPKSWFVVDNAKGSVAHNTDLIVKRILEHLGRPAPKPDSKTPQANVQLSLTSRASDNDASIRRSFYDYVRSLADIGNSRLAAYHSRSFDSEEAWELRERLLPLAPELVIYGISPLSSNKSIDMRWQMIDEMPERVARSLGGYWADEHEEAWAIREHVADKAPLDVALTLGTLDTERAWEDARATRRGSPGGPCSPRSSGSIRKEPGTCARVSAKRTNGFGDS